MKRNRSYKTELDPNNKQTTLFIKACGTARWTYNWALHYSQTVYKNWADSGKQEKSPAISAMRWSKELNKLKRLPPEQGGVPWMYEVSKCIPHEALFALEAGYKNALLRCKQGAKKKGFPKIKSKKNALGSFTVAGMIHIAQATIQLPRIGIIKLKERGYLPINGVKILSATVSEKAGRWFVSVLVEEQAIIPTPPPHIIGVDVGISNMAITSDGEVFENPKALRKAQKRLRQLNKAVSRKVKGGSNRRKVIKKLAKQHYKITCIRKDAINKATSAITKQASVIVIESLNVAGMLKNHSLAQAVSDAAMGEFLRQIKYKAEWLGVEVIEADRWFPSSKTCSCCGFINHLLTLKDRVFNCLACDLVIDRDLNAAINLKQLYLKIISKQQQTTGSSSELACCPESSGLSVKAQTKLLVGQELSRVNHIILNELMR